MSKVSKKNSGDTSKRILEAATALFAQRGFDGVSIKEICEAAGVNIAAIHYHFSSKEELYTRIIRDFGEDRAFRLERILKPPQTFDELALILRLVFEDMFDGFASNIDVARMVISEADLRRAACAKVFEDTFLNMHRRYTSFFQDCIDRGILPTTASPQATAMLIFGAAKLVITTHDPYRKEIGCEISSEKARECLIEGILPTLLLGLKPRT